jgi:hypothetical protein
MPLRFAFEMSMLGKSRDWKIRFEAELGRAWETRRVWVPREEGMRSIPCRTASRGTANWPVSFGSHEEPVEE